MATFFKAIRVGSFLYPTDLRVTGLTPRRTGAASSDAAIMAHVALGTTASPYTSLTRSFGVARDYALDASRAPPTAFRPAYVYEIEIPDPPPATLSLFDPVVQVAASLASPTSAISYHHNGDQSFILGVVDPKTMLAFRMAAVSHTPGTAPTPGPANLSRQLETMVRALRDAEALVMGNLPAVHIIDRHDIYGGGDCRMDTVSIDLTYLPSLGHLQIISADWWSANSRFVVFRYAIDQRPMEFGIAMDIDKGALLDSVVDDDADLVREQRGLEQCRVALWNIALEARRMVDQRIEPDDVGRARRHVWTAMMEAVLERSAAASHTSAS